MAIIFVADAILLALMQAKAKRAVDVAADAQVILAHNRCADTRVTADECARILRQLAQELKVIVEVPGVTTAAFSCFFPEANRTYRLTRSGHSAQCARMRATKLRIPRELTLVKM